ncbi:MAG: NfeD family protein [Elusimicrobia bacterium]|nr:NfeD family protein [Elusimicrobiota bacterium]
MEWYWIAAGIALIVIEVLVPTYFFLLSLGVASLIVGCLIFLGFITAMGPAVWTFCGFSVATLAPLTYYARRNRRQGGRRSNVEELIGKEGIVQERPGDARQPDSYLVMLAGDDWSARLGDAKAQPLAAGDKVRVKGVDGVHLIVEKI